MGQITHKKSYSKVYRTWVAMLSRCRNTNEPNYINYGARGIEVCERWHQFENFLEDMGDLPYYEAQIDRIDNDGNYCKENCRWVSPKENCRNTRRTKKHKTHMGTLVQVELMEKIGWTKNQFRWFFLRYGIEWILENFKNGTLPEKTNQEINREDIVGRNFGKWLVLKFESYSKRPGHLYLCRCECGNERLIARNNLMRSKSKQCHSCAAKEFWRKRNTI